MLNSYPILMVAVCKIKVGTIDDVYRKSYWSTGIQKAVDLSIGYWYPF